MIKAKLFLMAIVLIASYTLSAQGVAINNDGSSADGSAMLDVKSTDMGMLIPRMTEVQRDAIGTPATGLMIYQTDGTAGFYYYDGTSWTQMSGTTSSKWKIIDQNMYSDIIGNIGIGTTTPSEKVHIIGNNTYEGTTIVKDGNDRPSLFLTGSFPNIILGSNGNANHGSTLGFWNYDGSATTYQWNMGGGQDGNFSIGFATDSENPHCGINGFTTSCTDAITPFLITSDGNIGLSKSDPGAKLDINIPGNGLQKIINISNEGTSNGTADIASFQYDGDNAPYPLILNMNAQGDYARPFVINGGNVGIGIANPTQKLSVAGTIESTSGGVKFPDGTVQTTAASSFLPPGMIVPFAGDAAHVPAGWMLCDGSAISRTTHNNLFATISINYGYGDNSTTFNLPDLRGTFLRGVDGGSGNDPDAGSRTASNLGGNIGDNVGSKQIAATALPTTSAFVTNMENSHTHSGTTSSEGIHSHTGTTEWQGNHYHYLKHGAANLTVKGEISVAEAPGVKIRVLTEDDGDYLTTENTGTHRHSFSTSEAVAHTHNISTYPNGSHSHSVNYGGDNETRPVNVNVNYIIKL